MLVAICLLVACVAQARLPIVTPRGFSLASNHFGLNLYRQLSLNNAEAKENIFFSPYSIATAMSMLHQASDGTTQNQLEKVLGFRLAHLDKQLASDRFQNVTEALFTTGNSSNVLKTANGAVISETFAVKDPYKQMIQNEFRGEIMNADFVNKGTEVVQQVNTWVANQTEGRIAQPFTEPFDPNTQMVLLNTIFFKGLWKHPFKKDQSFQAPFQCVGGKQSNNADFMFKSKEVFSINLDEVESVMILLPYEQNEYALYAILPNNPESDLSQIRAALSPWYIESAISRLAPRDAVLKFPKFKFETKFEVQDILRSMGITAVFGNEAELPGLSDSKVAVSRVKHIANVELDEEGTVAAALTSLEIMKTSIFNPFEYNFNHPFVFFIRHQATGQLLFVGEVNCL